jgi:hypothetical protein
MLVAIELREVSCFNACRIARWRFGEGVFSIAASVQSVTSSFA